MTHPKKSIFLLYTVYSSFFFVLLLLLFLLLLLLHVFVPTLTGLVFASLSSVRFEHAGIPGAADKPLHLGTNNSAELSALLTGRVTQSLSSLSFA